MAALEPRPADVVLDLAGGTGDMAAALAGSVAHVLETDLAPAMVEAARRRRLEGVEHRVADMQRLDLPDAAVDAVVCRFGLMLVPEPRRALAEMRRVLRRGGRLALSTWAPARRNPWATAYGPVLVERGLLEPPQPDEPGQFALGDAGAVEALVRGAGFATVAVREVPLGFGFAGWDEYRRLVTGLAVDMRGALESLDERERAEVDGAARARIERFRVGSGYALPGLALVTSAR